MRYKINIKFKDNTKLDTEVDGYSTRNSVLELYTYNTQPNKIKIFPLIDITDIDIEDNLL
jgi:hypothetical protein